jgi:hypothetical protein
MPTIVSLEDNPFSGLAAMSAKTAILYEATRFIYMSSLGASCLPISIKSARADYLPQSQAYSWDWLVSMRQEYLMIKRDGLSLTTAMYMLSR